MSERLRLFLLISACVVVYGNSLGNSFTFDDGLYILRNPLVTHFSVPALFRPVQTSTAYRLFRPVTFASYALNWWAQAAKPFTYHLVNLLLQIVVTLLIYFLLRKLLASVEPSTSAAFAAALLFAVHPIHTEAVASIVGRSELLAAGFLFAAWLLHMQDWTVLSLLCFALALLSKESAIVFIPLAVAGDWVQGKWRDWRRYGYFAGVAAIFVAWMWRVQGGRLGVGKVAFLDNPLANIPASWRILNALRIVWKYVALQIYPATLSADYSYNAIRLYTSWRSAWLAALGILLTLALWLWTLRTGRKAWFLVGAIYLAGFAITANVLTPTGTIMAERLAYLPSAGFCLLIALLWEELESRKAKLAWALLTIILSALGTRTVIRNRDWHDNITLFSAAVRAVPGSAKAHSILGEELLAHGDLQTARRELQTSLQIYPDDPDAVEAAALVESQLGNDQEAKKLFERAVALAPPDFINYDSMVVNLSAELIKLNENEAALALLDRETAQSPGYSPAWSNRASIHYNRGQMELARSEAQVALRLDPQNTQAQHTLRLLNSAPDAFRVNR